MKTLVCDYTFMYLKEWRPAFALPQEPNWNSLESVHWLPSMSSPEVGNLFINVFTGGLLRFVVQFNVHCPQVRVEFSSAQWKGSVHITRVHVEIWQVPWLKQILFSFIWLFLLCSSVFFFIRYSSSQLYSRFLRKAPCSCARPVFFCLQSTEHIGENERPPVDGEKIGHSIVASGPFCHYQYYLYRAIISGSCDRWLMRQAWSKTRQPSAGVAFTSV